jgi:4-amino-4-deoxy-L-arabinose transferase-like glycosyltransferase
VLGWPARLVPSRWGAPLGPGRQTVIAICLILVLAAPLLIHAKPALLNADESLYLSEALNIAEGKGLTYTSGENIHHRPPLFPALLATDFKLLGTSEGNAYWVSKFAAVAAAVLVYLLGRELFGFWTGAAAAALTVASSYLSSLSTTLYLDTTETVFLLLSILLMMRALNRPTVRAFAWSGAALGAAFLAKETALLWLPLPFLGWLTWREHRSKEVGLGALAFAASFALVTAWWFVWVFVTTGKVFLLEKLGRGEVLLVGIAGLAALCAVVALLAGMRTQWLERRLAHAATGRWPATVRATLPVLGLLGLVIWCLLFLVGIQDGRAALTHEYWRTVPDYVRERLAGNVDPFYVLLASWVIVAWKAVRGSRGDGILLFALLLFSPVFLSVANSNLQVRQLAPAVYLSYLALGRAIGLLLDEIRSLAAEPSSAIRVLAYGMVAGLAIIGGTFVFTQQRSFLDANADIDSQRVGLDNWDNPLVQSTARWISENVPVGSHIMSSHLFHSQVYFLTGARYPIYQLPTVEVRINPAASQPLQPVSTLFRFEDNRLRPPQDEERWLYLEWVPVHNYWVALSEIDLLNDLRERNIQYLVITGDDHVYSSLIYVDYFLRNPAFTLLHSEDSPDGLIRLLVFKVDQSKLVPTNDHLTMRSNMFLALYWGVALREGGAQAAEVVRRISHAPVQISPLDAGATEANRVIAEIYGQ